MHYYCPEVLLNCFRTAILFVRAIYVYIYIYIFNGLLTTILHMEIIDF